MWGPLGGAYHSACTLRVYTYAFVHSFVHSVPFAAVQSCRGIDSDGLLTCTLIKILHEVGADVCVQPSGADSCGSARYRNAACNFQFLIQHNVAFIELCVWDGTAAPALRTSQTDSLTHVVAC